MRQHLVFALALLCFAMAQGSASPVPPPRCGIKIYAIPQIGRWFYTVKIVLKPNCPANAFADVRLESYVGGGFPHDSYFKVTHFDPLIRSGIPRYWRINERGDDGPKYHLLPYRLSNKESDVHF